MKEPQHLVGTLERELKALILEWERFFSGDRKLPPQVERTRLERRIRQLAEGGGLRGAARFRLDQLQHRFATYGALWERQLRQREEGRRIGAHAGRRVETATGRAQAAEASAGVGRPAANARAAASVKNGEGKSLYERWLAAKRRLGQSAALSREAFEARLEGQRRELERRLGRRVDFDVVVRDGRVKLVARTAAGNERG